MNFFYYTIAKSPHEMNIDELAEEIQAAKQAATRAKEAEQGISTKETVRLRACELALIALPGGIDRWNRI